jgi:hypothetical protein
MNAKSEEMISISKEVGSVYVTIMKSFPKRTFQIPDFAEAEMLKNFLNCPLEHHAQDGNHGHRKTT